ncbi:hypothetical protein BHYA_0078g00140 [Botrytis hyacinthi]|uniref:O-methyltransferase dimerisation domain-containing protein n=1 Tax=Botrytis hyacinthi TaxID=278943 RepID=A0A4Z1GS48_9HELO|nr:hypothetical protein BHYA_0078g00140 [Botrytis hyacinthi]
MEAIKTLAKEIQNSAATADEAGRKELLDPLRDLQYSIEKPEDTIQRVIHLHLVIAITRTAVDLKLLNILGDSDGPQRLQDLAVRTGADPALLGRILRMLSSLGMTKETGDDQFASSPTSKNLSIAEIQAGLYHKYENLLQSISPIFSDIIRRCSYDVLGPAYQVLPDFLASTKYQTPTETHKAAFQKA